jgi:hypothetical protein
LDKIDKQYLVNACGYYCYNAITSTRQVHIQKYIDTNEQLLRILRADYHLE